MDADSVHQHAASAAGDDHPYAQASYAHYFSSSSTDTDNEFDPDFTAKVEAMIVKEEVKVKPKPAKALVQKGIEDVYYVEKKGEKYIALGGKPEPTDTDNWGVLCRELGGEVSITTMTRVMGPLYRNGTNYYHVRTDQTPSNGDAVVMGFTMWELSTLKNKDFTLKRAMSLFPPPIPPQPPLPPTPPPPPPPPQQVWPVDNEIDGKGTCISSMAILMHTSICISTLLLQLI